MKENHSPHNSSTSEDIAYVCLGPDLLISDANTQAANSLAACRARYGVAISMNSCHSGCTVRWNSGSH